MGDDPSTVTQVFSAIAVSDRAVDEVQQTGVIALCELVEGMPAAVQVLGHQRRVEAGRTLDPVRGTAKGRGVKGIRQMFRKCLAHQLPAFLQDLVEAMDM